MPRPWLLRASGSLVGDEVTLFTSQSEAAYERLASTGFLRSLPGRQGIDVEDFGEAYNWMDRRMGELLPGDDGRGGSILWAWGRIGWRDLFNQLRWNRDHGDSVFLTLRVPRERVLLSGFGDWHAVLNRSLNVVPLPGESDAAWERRFDELIEDFFARTVHLEARPVDEWPNDLRVEIEESWDGIFDRRYWGTSAVQACLREIRTADVVRAVRIKQRWTGGRRVSA